jgi:isoaspartyl peptidase/L-asparaginase-like protein (Ntn-hydrolase superfamily)
MGIPEADRSRLITADAQRVWEEKKKIGHDTIGAITLDTAGNMAAATSTSGASMKTPGRVGDSPIIGSGFYVETGVGGAAATGWGEDIMRTCCSFRAVDLMRAGMPAQKAAETVVLTAHQTILRHGGKPDCIALVCMDAKGGYGGAANHKGFTYACGKEGEAPCIVHVTPIIDKDETAE